MKFLSKHFFRKYEQKNFSSLLFAANKCTAKCLMYSISTYLIVLFDLCYNHKHNKYFSPRANKKIAIDFCKLNSGAESVLTVTDQ